MKMIFPLFISVFFLFFVSSCQQEGAGTSTVGTAAPLSASEFDYFTKNYKGDAVKEGYSLSKLLDQSYEETYNREPARYEVSASKIMRDGESGSAGLLIAMKIDRIQSALLGKGQRKTETKYFCLPSSKANASLHSRYNGAVRELGYKDYEVFTTFLSKVLSDLL